MKIRFAEKSDIEILSAYDKHIRITELESSVSLGLSAKKLGKKLKFLNTQYRSFEVVISQS